MFLQALDNTAGYKRAMPSLPRPENIFLSFSVNLLQALSFSTIVFPSSQLCWNVVHSLIHSVPPGGPTLQSFITTHHTLCLPSNLPFSRDLFFPA